MSCPCHSESVLCRGSITGTEHLMKSQRQAQIDAFLLALTLQGSIRCKRA